MLCSARRIPSLRFSTIPPTTRAAAAFTSTNARASSRRAPVSTARMIAAFSLASPEASLANDVRAIPKSSGCTSNIRTPPLQASATQVLSVTVISSRPSAPWTTQACSVPSNARAPANRSRVSRLETPIICRGARAGFVNGPSRLNVVWVPNSRRIAATRAVAV